MKAIEKHEIHSLLLQILVEFHHFCIRNDIQYVLSDGTLLGSIRHKGFIPWDNDIDVSMLDSEYDKLVAIAQDNPFIDGACRYKILLPGILPNFHPFIKIIDTRTLLYDKDIRTDLATGIWLDVFRYSHGSRETLLKRFKQAQRYKTLNKIAVCGNVTTPKYKAIYPAILLAQSIERLLGYDIETIMRKMISLESDLPFEGEYLMDVTWADKQQHHFLSKWFEDVTLVPFEGYEFFAPKEYEAVLTQQFGNYLELPPEEQRQGHPFSAFFI